MIKVLGAINFDIEFIVDDLSEKLHGLRALQLMSKFHCDTVLHGLNIADLLFP